MTGRDGPRQLTIGAVRTAEGVSVTLTDTGHGLDPATRPRLFDPFFTTKPQGVGTGIGLSVCLGIIRAHGGTITLDPAPGGGAVARVDLPAATLAPVAETQVIAQATVLSGRVLVVDDEPAIADWLSDLLTGMGLQVTTATGGQAALRAMAAARFDALITDLRMPDLDGDRLAAAITDPRLARRIIVMTGDALGAEVAITTPVAAILEKPVDPALLRATLARLLEA